MSSIHAGSLARLPLLRLHWLDQLGDETFVAKALGYQMVRVSRALLARSDRP